MIGSVQIRLAVDVVLPPLKLTLTVRQRNERGLQSATIAIDQPSFPTANAFARPIKGPARRF